MQFYWCFGAHRLAGVALRACGTSSTDPKLLTRVGRKKAALPRGLFRGKTGMKGAQGRMDTLEGGEKSCDTTRTHADQPKRHMRSPASRNQRHRPGLQQLGRADEPTGAAGDRHLPKKALAEGWLGFGRCCWRGSVGSEATWRVLPSRGSTSLFLTLKKQQVR